MCFSSLCLKVKLYPVKVKSVNVSVWRLSRCFGDTSHYILYRLIFKQRGICSRPSCPHSTLCLVILHVKNTRHFLPPCCLCHSAFAVAVCFALFPCLFLSFSLFPHSLSLAAAQQPLALQIQPLISDLGGCLGEEGYRLHVCMSVHALVYASSCLCRPFEG